MARSHKPLRRGQHGDLPTAALAVAAAEAAADALAVAVAAAAAVLAAEGGFGPASPSPCSAQSKQCCNMPQLDIVHEQHLQD